MKKWQLFQNRLFLALFILNKEKMTSWWRHCWFDPDFLYRKIVILSQSNSVQNLSILTLKTKKLWRGVEPPPPLRCYTSQKSPVLIGLRFCWQQLFTPLRNITISLKSIRPNKTEIKIIAEKSWINVSTRARTFSACTTLWSLLQRLTHWAIATVEKLSVKLC